MIAHQLGLDLVPWWLRALSALIGVTLSRLIMVGSLTGPVDTQPQPIFTPPTDGPSIRFVPHHMPLPPAFIREAYAIKPEPWHRGDCRQRCFKDLSP